MISTGYDFGKMTKIVPQSSEMGGGIMLNFAIGIWMMVFFTTMDGCPGWMKLVVFLVSAANMACGAILLGYSTA